MLTEEQIKNLKPGDPIVIHTTVRYIDTEGDLWFPCPRILDAEDSSYIDPKHVSLPSGTVEQPKHDPTRLFKKGDKVRVVEWNGRKNIRAGMIGKVVSDEFNCKVELAIDGWPNGVYYQACFLELVTSVEELEPYSIDPANTNVLFKRGKKFATFEDDDEAQEVCDRLNAEHRKERENG